MRGLRTSYIFCLQAKTKMKSISWKTKTLELTEWRKRSTFLFFLVFNFLMVKMKLKTFFTRFILNFSHFLAMWQKFTYKLQTESKQTKTQKWTPSPGRTGPLRLLVFWPFQRRSGPWHVGHTGSHLNTEVKQRWARLVLGWVTVWVLAGCCWSRSGQEFGVGFFLTKSSQNHVQTRLRCLSRPVYTHMHVPSSVHDKDPNSIFRKRVGRNGRWVGNMNTRMQ